MKQESYYDICVIYDNDLTPAEKALWINFVSGASTEEPNVYAISTENGGALVSSDVREFFNLNDIIPKLDYTTIYNTQIESIFSLRKELEHWDTILSGLEKMGNDILRFVIIHQVPLERIIRHILARKLIDTQGNPCSKEEAKKIWSLEDE